MIVGSIAVPVLSAAAALRLFAITRSPALMLASFVAVNAACDLVRNFLLFTSLFTGLLGYCVLTATNNPAIVVCAMLLVLVPYTILVVRARVDADQVTPQLRAIEGRI